MKYIYKYLCVIVYNVFISIIGFDKKSSSCIERKRKTQQQNDNEDYIEKIMNILSTRHIKINKQNKKQQ